MNIINRLLLIILILSFSIINIFAEDYQYQYFANPKKKYVPFSDYIPRYKLHMQTQPHYVEDFYLLYSMPLYYNENSLRANIKRLKFALNTRFRHPKNALIRINSRQEYTKYRRLLFMHINILIMRNYLKIGVRYDKRRIYFYDKDFKKHIVKSLKIAKKMYEHARPYWKQAKKLAQNASEIKITLNMGRIESERYSIITGEIDYGRIISGYISRVQRKQQKLNNMN